MRERGDDYLDLVEAVERGELRGSGDLDPPKLRETYEIDRDRWDHMLAELFMEAMTDAGSIDQAAAILGMPRSRIVTWLSWARGHAAGAPTHYLVALEEWDRMAAELLLAVVEDAGSGRRAAKVLGLHRSTLGARVRRSRRLLGTGSEADE